MAKPATKAAAPAAKKPKEPEANADGHVEINTDAPRAGPVGEVERHPVEDTAIAAAAKRGEGVELLEGSDGEAGHVAPHADADAAGIVRE